MLDVLHAALEELPELLADRSRWSSLHVTYHPPEVERLWTPFRGGRLFLHRIHPCEGDVLFHPHPWPSAVRIYSGSYRHVLGADAGDGSPFVVATEVLARGSEYEMVDRRAWHSVEPLGLPSDSIMVTGPLYEPRVEMPEAPAAPQEPLSPAAFDVLFGLWQARFRDRTW